MKCISKFVYSDKELKARAINEMNKSLEERKNRKHLMVRFHEVTLRNFVMIITTDPLHGSADVSTNVKMGLHRSGN